MDPGSAGGTSSGGTSSGGASSGGASSGGFGAGGSGNSAGTGATGGAGGNFAQCDAPGTCALVPTNCCGYCQPGAPLSGFLAVNEKHVGDVLGELCADPVACPDCITWQDPHYLALCRSGKCTAVDLRQDDLSACNADSDCKLRWGSNCCESCSGNQEDIIVYNKNASFAAEVCGPFGGACPPCMPPEFPEYLLPYCDAGHCRWTLVGP